MASQLLNQIFCNTLIETGNQRVLVYEEDGFALHCFAANG